MATSVGLLPVLCLLLTLGHLSAGILVLNVKPDAISPGLTSDLTVNCSFTYNNQPNISTIMSLIISKADSHNSEPGSFSEVLSINSFTNQINHKGSTNAVASGNIDSNTLDAFLSLSWSSPSQAESGFYRCDANVMDDFGHPVDISTLAEVTSSEPDLNVLIGIVGTLQADLAVVKSELNTQVQTNEAQNATIFEMQQDFENQLQIKTSQITDLQTKLNQQTSDLQEAMFIKSETYNGHFYLIPGIYVAHINVAEYLCNISQGYLAEIKDESEHQFIVNFITAQDSYPFYLVGATKDDQSGQWVFRHSGRSVTYFKWNSGEPNNGLNCMAIYSGTGEMYDRSCGLTSTISFLCEIPES